MSKESKAIEFVEEYDIDLDKIPAAMVTFYAGWEECEKEQSEKIEKLKQENKRLMAIIDEILKSL